MSETTMVNLSVLSQLTLGERLRVRRGRFFQLYSERNTGGFTLRMPEMLQRWWDGSSRHSDFAAILDCYDNASTTLRTLAADADSAAARATETALVRRLRASLQGLQMLRRTYASDITLVSRIQRLEERVRQLCEPFPTAAQDNGDPSAPSPDPPPFALDANAPAYGTAPLRLQAHKEPDP